MGRIHGSGRRHSAYDWKQTDLPVKKRNHRTDLRYSERTAWISIYAVCRKSTDGNESRAYLCMHEFEKTGKDPGKTRLEHSQIFVDFEENKKKRSFKRKMVLGITPNTKFVYSLKSAILYSITDLLLFAYIKFLLLLEFFQLHHLIFLPVSHHC